MQKINKAGIIIILMVLMFDAIILIVGVKEGAEPSIVLFNIGLFLTGSLMYGIE